MTTLSRKYSKRTQAKKRKGIPVLSRLVKEIKARGRAENLPTFSSEMEVSLPGSFFDREEKKF